jgi:Bacterial shufflon protein, N-terminal constant region
MAPIIGTLAAMLISLLTVVGFTAWAKMGVANIRIAATAGQLVIVAKATQQYVQDNSASLATSATSATPVTLSVATLKSAGYLPAGLQSVNPYGQTWQAQVLQPSAGQLEVLVTSTGGTAISDPKQLVQIAAQAGAQGGYVPYAGQLGDASMSASNAVGAFGGWSRAVAPFSNPGSGHLAALIAFGGPATNNSYLYRVAVAGQPQLNTMQTSLSMSGNDINAANSVNATTVTASSTVSAGTVNASGAVSAGGSMNASGNVTAGGTMSAAGGRFNVDSSGRIGTAGYAAGDLPPGWGGGVSTSDVYSHATVAAGTGGGIASYLNSGGELMAGSGQFRVTSTGVVNLGAQGSAGAGCSISNGSSAITSDTAGVLLACVGGVWRPVGGRQQKQQFYTTTDGGVIPNPGCPATATAQIIVTPMNIYIDNTAVASYTASGAGPWTVFIRDGANVAIAGATAQVETYCAYP